jgi:8-oxo-dGTP diphosphatase
MEYMEEKKYFVSLPKKRMASGVLFFDKNNNLLIVKTRYKANWSIPGGVIEEDESPQQAALREVKEELGLKIKKIKFLVIDYIDKKNSGYKYKLENIQFLFYGGVLSMDQIRQIKIPNDEIVEYRFVLASTAKSLLSGNLGKRLPFAIRAIKTNRPAYLEAGTLH